MKADFTAASEASEVLMKEKSVLKEKVVAIRGDLESKHEEIKRVSDELTLKTQLAEDNSSSIASLQEQISSKSQEI